MKWTRMIPAAVGPMSWCLLLVLPWIGKQRGGGEWAGLYEWCLSVALIVIVHVVAPLVVLGQMVVHRRDSLKERLPLILGLVYYVAAGLVSCVLVNPFMLWDQYVVESFKFMLTGFTT